jgi:hypothetical protein
MEKNDGPPRELTVLEQIKVGDRVYYFVSR